MNGSKLSQIWFAAQRRHFLPPPRAAFPFLCQVLDGRSVGRSLGRSQLANISHAQNLGEMLRELRVEQFLICFQVHYQFITRMEKLSPA